MYIGICVYMELTHMYIPCILGMYTSRTDANISLQASIVVITLP